MPSSSFKLSNMLAQVLAFCFCSFVCRRLGPASLSSGAMACVQGFVQTTDVVTHKYRANVRVNVSKGVQDDGLYHVVDRHVLGPYYSDKASAAADKDKFVSSFEERGRDGLFEACRQAFQLSCGNVHAGRVIGSEIEVESRSDGVRKSRAVIHVRSDERAQLEFKGPHRLSRAVAERDLESLKRPFEQQRAVGGKWRADVVLPVSDEVIDLDADVVDMHQLPAARPRRS